MRICLSMKSWAEKEAPLVKVNFYVPMQRFSSRCLDTPDTAESQVASPVYRVTAESLSNRTQASLVIRGDRIGAAIVGFKTMVRSMAQQWLTSEPKIILLNKP